MPEHIQVEGIPVDKLALLLAHLFDQMQRLNENLAAIVLNLEGIRERLSYANVLDSQD